MADLIHLIRHGEVHNPDNICYADIESFGLSELGRLQAAEVGGRLSEAPPVACYVSPLRRARETWQETGLAVEAAVRSGLTEWGLAQRWKGYRWHDLDHYFPGEIDQYWADPTRLPFSPESLTSLAERMQREVEEADRRHPTGSVAFVTHQDPLQAARLVLTGRPLGELHVDKPVHGSVITIRPADGLEIAHWQPGQR